MTGRTYLGIPRDQISWSPTIDRDQCIGCGECLSVCPNGVFSMDVSDNKMFVSLPDNCVVLCDKCASFCEQNAISFPNKEVFKEEILRLVAELQKVSVPLHQKKA